VGHRGWHLLLVIGFIVGALVNAVPASASRRDPLTWVITKTRESRQARPKIGDSSCPPSSGLQGKSSTETDVYPMSKVGINETVTMTACWVNGAVPASINGGTWMLTSGIGSLFGTVKSGMKSDLGPLGLWTTIEMPITSGTNLFWDATGTVYYWACGNGRRAGLSLQPVSYTDHCR